ncbi:MAG: aminoacyl-tRNA hydrolase [Aureispira sp.]
MFKWLKQLLATSSDKEEQKNENIVKYLITGLGNPGVEYNGTRHNIGFDVVDYLAAKFDVSYKSDRQGYVGSFKHKGRQFILLKPTTYMNLSGQAVRYWLQKEKIKKENLLVILDDLNLKFGQIRLKGKGSAGGHNGLKNIEQLLQTGQYPRLKVGIGDRFNKGRQVDFVLGKWNEEEDEHLSKIIAHAAQGVLEFGTIGLERTMNRVNTNVLAEKKKPQKKTPPKSKEKDTDTTPPAPTAE